MRKDLQVRDGLPKLPYRIMWYFGAFVARCLFNRKLNVSFENWQLFDDLEPPFLVVGNHVTNFDPVIIASNQKHIVHWVAGDAVFRHPVMRWIFTRIQVIPKTKGTSDLETVRAMHKKIREGAVVGVYPEGQTNWDGLSQKVVPSTPKLLKLFKVPVVSVLNKGGYLTKPRWAWSLRRRQMVFEAKMILDSDEANKLSVEEIAERLQQGINHDDFHYQQETMLPLETDKPAETIELFTYVCPRCETIDALMSERANVKCTHCGWSFTVDKYGRFPEKSEDYPFDSLSDWNAWQKKWTRGRADAYRSEESPSKPILRNRGLTLLTGKGLKPLKKQAHGDLNLWHDRLEFLSDKGKSFVFPLDEIEALSLFKQQRFEFYLRGALYRFNFDSPRDSAYKWFRFLEDMTGQDPSL